PPIHWWDWPSVTLLFILLHTVASRLVITTWTPYLHLVQTFTSMGFVIGASLGYSSLKPRTARWLVLGYMLVMLPLVWTRIIDQQVKVEERLLSVGGRLLYSLSEFFSRRPVEDPLFFVAIMSITFWIISASAGYRLTRHQNFLASALPSALGILILQNYDNAVSGRLLILALFGLVALFLLGRLNFLQDQKRWRDRRVFLSPENSIDLTSGMAIAATLIIITAWTIPPSFIRIESVRRAWNQITKPWNDFTDRLENAVSALDSPSGGKPGEFYGTELELGLGFPLSDTLMFRVEVPDLPAGQKPPRFYWRGRIYDYFAEDQWFTTGAVREPYTPLNEVLNIAYIPTSESARFLFNTGEQKFSLIYVPSQSIWFSRPGSILTSPAGEEKEVTSWNASPLLLPGETYQVDAILNNPNIQQLRAAGTEYPEWVTAKYLQLPEDFSPRIAELAIEVTANAETPYDKTGAITRYLRETIKYSPTVPRAPRNTDPLEWILFEHKQAYCVYYATAEVLMLRSLGIPARLAVGFAQGTGTAADEGFAEQAEGILTNEYTVRKNNAHAWPEVYFPGAGWVEFEPTGNQAPLDRPLAPRDDTDPSLLSNPDSPLNREDSLFGLPGEGRFNDPLDSANTSGNSFIALLYLIPILTAPATLIYFLSRRYALPARIPTLMRTAIERGGVEAPNWVIRWERWGRLSPIERAFESINFGLRNLESPPPIHATPAERADKLVSILPKTSPIVKILLDEHQTYLYTSRTADVDQARRAAFTLRTQVLLARIRHFWTGKYSLKM
ncbi:MAG TPA: transglutaminase-like domain-containing protein, partial [Anaerolineales bacterium]|nr:transglutaminase-like domain-containing protein [Anaerolineales bacterium]